jgi:signal transduction histidine kinase
LGRHLQELTDDFLDVSRMKAGTTTLNLETVDVRLLIESALDAIAPLIEDRPVSTSAEIDSALPVICADKRRLRHVMLHLLSSVATFTESGWISVRARRIEALNVETERVEPFVEVRIHTSGQGVSEGYAGDTPRALPRFGDLPSAGRGAQDFMLPVSQTLIDLHGGRMWTDARCSEEVTLTFVLPVAGPGAVNERLSERSEANGVETKSADIV